MSDLTPDYWKKRFEDASIKLESDQPAAPIASPSVAGPGHCRKHGGYGFTSDCPDCADPSVHVGQSKAAALTPRTDAHYGAIERARQVRGTVDDLHFARQLERELSGLSAELQASHESLSIAERELVIERTAVDEATRALTAIQGEIAMIDGLLARRPALAECKTRYDMISLALHMAGKADEAERSDKHTKAVLKEMERDLRAQLVSAERKLAIESAIRVQLATDSQNHLDRALAAERLVW